MKKDKTQLSVLSLILTMTVFGTVGFFRRWIPLEPATLAGARGLIGVLTLLLILLCKRQKPDFSAIRKNLFLLILSGACIGFNWILLFEAYDKTSIAVATLCYYTAPIFVILAAPFLLKEKMTLRKTLCVLAAAVGMVFVSGVFEPDDTEKDLVGILYGIGAAILYAGVMLINRKIRDINAYDKTAVQLLVAAIAVAPYAALTETVTPDMLTLRTLLLVLALGIVHTGLCYALYFGAIGRLNAQSAALLGYIDPMVAVLLSVTVLRETASVSEIIGIVCIFGATVAGEISGRKSKKTITVCEKNAESKRYS